MWGKLLVFAVGATVGVIGKIIYDDNKPSFYSRPHWPGWPNWAGGPETQPDKGIGSDSDSVESSSEEPIDASQAEACEATPA